MPLYSYRCEDGHEFDEFLSLKDYNKKILCKCGKPSRKLIKPTMVNCDIQPWDYYESPVSGKVITSYKERKEDMVRNDCVDYDPGMRKNAEKFRKRKDAELDKKVDETVEREFEKMDSRKRERFTNELLSSDIVVERK